MMIKSFAYRIFIVLISVSITFSCEEFVQVELPNSQISSSIVFENDETAMAAANGIYKSILEDRNLIGGSFDPMSYVGGLSSDELIDLTGTSPYREFYDDQINANNPSILNLWSGAYKAIYEANAVIEGVTSSTSLSKNVQRQLLGEGKFVRALHYFYLVNLFGDVPLVTSTDYRNNATIKRASIVQVYELIKTDLIDAKGLLTEEYFTSYKTRPNKWAAAALLARIYLYERDYTKAEEEATTVINTSAYSLVANLDSVFHANSSESILELSQVYPWGFPTADGTKFLRHQFVNPLSSLSGALLNSFEFGDLRFSDWIISFNGTTYDPYKYKVRTYFTDANYPENLVLLRLAELYLIRAEARAEQGDITNAQSDLNIIRNRAGLPNTEADDQASLRLAIEEERRHEFFCEMGHRWLDLKRTNRADAILGPLKASWNSIDVYYPIPEQEMLNNPNLTPQNDGY